LKTRSWTLALALLALVVALGTAGYVWNNGGVGVYSGTQPVQLQSGERINIERKSRIVWARPSMNTYSFSVPEQVGLTKGIPMWTSAGRQDSPKTGPYVLLPLGFRLFNDGHGARLVTINAGGILHVGANCSPYVIFEFDGTQWIEDRQGYNEGDMDAFKDRFNLDIAEDWRRHKPSVFSAKKRSKGQPPAHYLRLTPSASLREHGYCRS
jgi:hypothetical protein